MSIQSKIAIKVFIECLADAFEDANPQVAANGVNMLTYLSGKLPCFVGNNHLINEDEHIQILIQHTHDDEEKWNHELKTQIKSLNDIAKLSAKLYHATKDSNVQVLQGDLANIFQEFQNDYDNTPIPTFVEKVNLSYSAFKDIVVVSLRTSPQNTQQEEDRDRTIFVIGIPLAVYSQVISASD